MSDKRRFCEMERSNGQTVENPPYSRLFVVCNKWTTEETLRNEFSKFGDIEEVWTVKDRQTGESKGVGYVKYSLTSSAAKALEEMKGKFLDTNGRPIKVFMAQSRGDSNKKDQFEEDRLLRLFIVCKKDATEADLEDHFKQFGQIDSIKLVKNRDSNENKGFAYVKYYKISHAALAYENCDRSHRPKFAEPKPQNRPNDGGFESPYSYDKISSPSSRSSTGSFGGGGGDIFTKLQMLVSPLVTQDQLWRLCDLAPGLEYCRIHQDFHAKSAHDRVMASVRYSTPGQAAYAREKLSRIEYPPGMSLSVRADWSEPISTPSIPSFNIPSSASGLSKSDIEILAENVKQATALLMASSGLKSLSPSSNDPNYCSVKLPEKASFEEEEDDGTESRLFVVFNPSIPERPAIKDVFGRFGRITDLFLLAGKNVGYITYARMESVKNAIAALHGQELCGMYMKVMEAEPRRRAGPPEEDRRKRIKVDENE